MLLLFSPFSLTEPNLLPFYEEVIREGKLRVLVYNGDTDPGERWRRARG